MKAVIATKSSSYDIDKQIGSLTAGAALPYFKSIFSQLAMANPKNANILCQFLKVQQTGYNIKLGTRLIHIKIICWLDRYLNHKYFGDNKK